MNIRFFLLLLGCLFTSHAIANTAPAVSANSSLQIARDINKLYISIIKNDVDQTKRKDVICKQLPSKLNQYSTSTVPTNPSEKQQQAIFLSTLKQNIDQTKDYFNISC